MNMDYVIAFLVGGVICALTQILMEKTKLLPGRIMVLLVCTGCVLGAIGIYQPFVDWAGAGASVPLTGFGYSLAEGAIEGARSDGLLGAITGSIKATAAGIAAAIFFGYLFALIFTPKTKD